MATTAGQDNLPVMMKKVRTHTVLQMEAVECGAASLAMVLDHHGLILPLERLRVDCGVSRDGSKASNIVKAARKYGLVAKGFRKEPEDLRYMRPPMILHWEFNHFVVLDGYRNGFYYINDPAQGPRVIPEKGFGESFTGIVLTFEPGPDFHKGGRAPSAVGAVLRRLRGNESALAYLTFVSLAMVLPGLVVPVFTRVFIDRVLLADLTNWVQPLLAGMLLTAVLRGVLTYLQQIHLVRLQTRIALHGAARFMWHVFRLPIQFFSQRYSAEIGARSSINTSIAGLITGNLAPAGLNILMIVFYVVLLLRYDVVLTLIGVSATLMNLLYLRFVNDKLMLENQKMYMQSGKLAATAMAGLQGIETLKATGSESDFFAKWSGNQANYFTSSQAIHTATNYLLSVPSLLTGLTSMAILVVGGMHVLDGRISIGGLVAFQSLMASFMGPVSSLLGLGSSLQQLQGDLKRLDDVMDHPIDESFAEFDNPQVEPAGDSKLAGHIVIRDLTFGYSPLDPPLIENFSLTLRPGSRVALVGGSGSGKSTIAKLISGLMRPWSGEILFDGKQRKSVPRAVLTGSMAIVDQDICVFEGSIRDNLTMWDSTISESDVIQAGKDAAIHDDILARDRGYDAVLEEGGRNFSGGQLQRLEIARALALNPTIMILDEATSALDPLTEQIIDDNIRRRGCTCVIVAHRLSTIRDADEIIVLDHGLIVQRGTHDELRRAPGHYASLIDVG